jgi:hypothetical protein
MIRTDYAIALEHEGRSYLVASDRIGLIVRAEPHPEAFIEASGATPHARLAPLARVALAAVPTERACAAALRTFCATAPRVLGRGAPVKIAGLALDGWRLYELLTGAELAGEVGLAVADVGCSALVVIAGDRRVALAALDCTEPCPAWEPQP